MNKPPVAVKTNKPLNQKLIEEKFKEIMEDGLGLDMTNPSLQKTPYRIAKMYVNEIFRGLDENNLPKTTVFDNEESNISYNGMVLLKNMTVYSSCEHHFLPFTMKISIGYIPNKKVIGVSKLARISKFFAAKPQVQERLTEEIANYIQKELKPLGTIVAITHGQHLCMQMRGVENTTSEMETIAVRGIFLTNDKGCKDEFMSRITK